MAKNQTDGEVVVDAPASDEAATPAKQAKPRTTITVATNVPPDMKSVIDKVAESAGKSTAVWVRELLASTVNYELPPAIAKGRKTNKYEGMTDEQKKQAQAAEQAAKRHTAAALLAALDAGDLNVDLASILEKYKPATRAPRKTESVSTDAESPAVEPANA